jgi:hypothetical protein
MNRGMNRRERLRMQEERCSEAPNPSIERTCSSGLRPLPHCRSCQTLGTSCAERLSRFSNQWSALARFSWCNAPAQLPAAWAGIHAKLVSVIWSANSHMEKATQRQHAATAGANHPLPHQMRRQYVKPARGEDSLLLVVGTSAPAEQPVPNPSIERTCSSGLRPLPHAAHVKR